MIQEQISVCIYFNTSWKSIIRNCIHKSTPGNGTVLNGFLFCFHNVHIVINIHRHWSNRLRRYYILFPKQWPSQWTIIPHYSNDRTSLTSSINISKRISSDLGECELLIEQRDYIATWAIWKVDNYSVKATYCDYKEEPHFFRYKQTSIYYWSQNDCIRKRCLEDDCIKKCC